MNHGLLGKKREMTQIFDESGNVVPVTIVDISSSVIVDINNEDKKITLGIGKKRNPTKDLVGKYSNIKYVPEKVKEFELYKSVDGVVGQTSQPNLKIGDKIMVTGTTKGKGFQGVVKKFGFAGGPKTHGQSDRHRAPGSIGGGTTPGRVLRGKKMPGRMGGNTKTIVGLTIAMVDQKNSLLGIKGAIPGNKNSIVYIRKSR